MLAGWQIGSGDVLGCMDADLQHPPERLVNLVESVSVVALIPVALGAFGVYSRLLHTF